MAVDLPLWARFALLFVASAASPPFESVRNALVPTTLPGHQLTDGIALQVLTNEVTRLIGLVAGGIGATIASPAAALTVNAGTFIVSALLIAGLEEDGPIDELRESVRVGDGWRAVRRDPLIRRIAWMSPTFVAFGAIPEALVVPYAEDELSRSGAIAGVLAALISLSILAIAPLIPRQESHRALVRQAAGAALAGSVIGAMAFSVPPNLAVAMVGFVAIGPIFVGRINLGAAMMHRLPDHLRASTFSLVDGFISVGQVVAGLGGGLLAVWIGLRPTFAIAMLLTAVSAGLAYTLPLRVHAAVSRAG
jgi:hypothetical protein